MENNEILQEILKQLQTQNQINVELSEELKNSQVTNKQLLEGQEKLQAYINEIEKRNSTSVTISKQSPETVSLIKPEVKEPLLTTNNVKIEPTLSDVGMPSQQVADKINQIENNPINMIGVGILTGDSKEKSPNKQFTAFKTLMSSHISGLNTKYNILNSVEKSIKSLKDNLVIQVTNKWASYPSMNVLYGNVKDKLLEQAVQSGVIIKAKVSTNKDNLVTNLGAKTQNFYDTVFLFGEKKSISKLKKNFASALEMIGFQAEELAYDHKKGDYVMPETIVKNLDQKLEENFKITKSADNYLLPALENLNDITKAEMVSKIIWPNLMKEIENSLGLLISIDQSKNDNKYFKLLNNFSKINGITSETALHCLENQPNLLSQYKNHTTLLQNKEGIINNMDKYERLSHNNFVVLQSLIKAGTDIQKLVETLNIPNKTELIDSMASTKVANSGKNSFSFSTIQKNVVKLFTNNNLGETIQNNRENKQEKYDSNFKTKFGNNA